MTNGGYYHESGEFTQENTLLVTLVNVKESIADDIAKDLCVFFHQESVLVTYDHKTKTKVIEEVL